MLGKFSMFKIFLIKMNEMNTFIVLFFSNVINIPFPVLYTYGYLSLRI